MEGSTEIKVMTIEGVKLKRVKNVSGIKVVQMAGFIELIRYMAIYFAL